MKSRSETGSRLLNSDARNKTGVSLFNAYGQVLLKSRRRDRRSGRTGQDQQIKSRDSEGKRKTRHSTSG